MHCPYCNALNPDDAAWCGLCLRAFEKAKPEPAPVMPQPESSIERTVRVTPDSPETQSAWKVVEKKLGSGEKKISPTWTCGVCSGENPLDINTCTTCGTSIFDTYSKQEEASRPRARQDRNPNVAAALSILPGAGHLYLGLNAEGVVRIILGVWWLSFGLLLTSGPTVLVPIGALIILAYFGLAGISGFDAFRVSSDPDEAPILNRQIILYSSLGIVLLTIFGALLTIFALRS